MDVNPYESPLASTIGARPISRSRLWARLVGFGLLLTLACLVMYYAFAIYREYHFDSFAVRMELMGTDYVLSLGAWSEIGLTTIGIVGWTAVAIFRK